VTAASDAGDQQTLTRPSEDFIYETPKRNPFRQDDEYYDGKFLRENAKNFGRENVGSVGSLYLIPYV
jgi:hypothetical protein